MADKSGFDQFLRGGTAIARKIKLGTAVDSDIAMAALVSVPCIGGYIFIREWPLLAIGAIPLVLYAVHYGRLLSTKPEYLRSERHTETMRRIEVGAMGDSDKIISEQTYEDLPSVTGVTPMLESKEQK